MPLLPWEMPPTAQKAPTGRRPRAAAQRWPPVASSPPRRPRVWDGAVTLHGTAAAAPGARAGNRQGSRGGGLGRPLIHQRNHG